MALIRIAPGKSRVSGLSNCKNKDMKDTSDTQWVTTPTRKRLATSRKRALRSRIERSARSVCSERQSCVIQSRNSAQRRSLPALTKGGSTGSHEVRPPSKAERAMCEWVRPGSKSGAEAYWGILGTWEDRNLLNVKTTGIRVEPDYQIDPATAELCSHRNGVKLRTSLRYLIPSSRQGIRDGQGRLSCLIVAFEIRETLPEGSL